jgi:hypothetical protein
MSAHANNVTPSFHRPLPPHIQTITVSKTVDLQVGNLRISYLDFRVIFYGIAAEHSSALIESRYVDHAIMALYAIGTDSGSGPNIFHLELPRRSSSNDRPQVHEWAYLVRSWLGVEWLGQFLVSAQKETPLNYGPHSFDKPAVYTWLEEHNSDIKYVDESHMALSAMHDTEHGLAGTSWSQHYHRRCETNGMHVCSVVCDATAQQISNLAFVRKRRNRGQKTPTQSHAPHNSSMKFCLLCPSSLVPFTIKSLTDKHNLSCSSYLPASRLAA